MIDVGIVMSSVVCLFFFLFFFFKQKTAYEIGTGDWSSDVCSSDLLRSKGAPLGTEVVCALKGVLLVP